MSESETTVLDNINKAKELIARAKSLDEARNITDALAVAEFAARKKGLDEVEQLAIEYKLWAQRRIGELLIQMKETGERAKPGGDRPSKSAEVFDSNQNSTMEAPKTLKQLGISKNDSSRYQQLAEMDKESFIKFANEAAKKAVRLERNVRSDSNSFRMKGKNDAEAGQRQNDRENLPLTLIDSTKNWETSVSSVQMTPVDTNQTQQSTCIIQLRFAFDPQSTPINEESRENKADDI